MDKKNQNSFDHAADRKYVVIKIPRESIQKSIFSYAIAYTPLEKFQRTVWIFLCVLALLIGMALGTVFHSYLLHESTDKPGWKSSALTVPDHR